jgi:hypothetical protein
MKHQSVSQATLQLHQGEELTEARRAETESRSVKYPVLTHPMKTKDVQLYIIYEVCQTQQL